MLLLVWWDWLCPPVLSFHCHHRSLLQPSSRLCDRHCYYWGSIWWYPLSSHHPTYHTVYRLLVVYETDSPDLSNSLRFCQRIHATISGTSPNCKRMAKSAHSPSPSIRIYCTWGISARICAVRAVDIHHLVLQSQRLFDFNFLRCIASSKRRFCVWSLSPRLFR